MAAVIARGGTISSGFVFIFFVLRNEEMKMIEIKKLFMTKKAVKWRADVLTLLVLISAETLNLSGKYLLVAGFSTDVKISLGYSQCFNLWKSSRTKKEDVSEK